MAEKEARPNPLEGGKGRIDEVDQSKGIFPPGRPHPPGAEERAPGAFGGGPYEESGRGGIELGGPSGPGAPVGEPIQQPLPNVNVDEQQRAEPKEPAGALPPHERK